MRVRHSITIIILMAVLPFVSFALTQEELQAQITALLQQVQALQAQLGTTGGTTNIGATHPNTTTTGTTNTSGSPVLGGGLTLTRYLEREMSGEDVSRLQAFLARDPSIYPDGLVTGFFGPLTERAVERFQVACGIVSAGDYQSTGYGRVGPRTRAALQNGCTGGVAVPSVVGALLKVTPVSGVAPLTVSAEAIVNTPRSCDAAGYILDFGDGTQPNIVSVSAQTCAELTRTISHTYQTPGTYTVSLGIGSHKTTVQVSVSGAGSTSTTGQTSTSVNTSSIVDFTTCSLTAGSVIMESYPRQCRSIDGRTFVESYTGSTGTNYSTANRLSVTPTTGTAPLSVVGQLQIRPGDPYEIDWGDGSAPTTNGSFTDRQSLPITTAFTQALQDVSLQHTYTTGGTKTVILKLGQYEAEGNQYVWRTRFFTRLVNISGGTTSTTGDNLTATPTSGAKPLTVTFAVRINGSGSCNGGEYTLDFGDGIKSSLLYPADACASASFSVTHQYVSDGTYTVKLYSVAQANIGSSSPVKTATIVVGTGTTATTTGSVPFTVVPGINSNPRQVEVRFTMDSCAAYTLTWGDGQVSNRTTTTGSCSSSQVTLQHTYGSDGTFTITLTTDGGAQNATLSISS